MSSRTVRRIENGETARPASVGALEAAVGLRDRPGDHRALNPVLAEFGRTFREIRRRMGLTPADMTSLCGITPTVLSRFERGLREAGRILRGGVEPDAAEDDEELASWGLDRRTAATAVDRAPARVTEYEWSRHAPWELFFQRADYETLSAILEAHLLR